MRGGHALCVALVVGLPWAGAVDALAAEVVVEATVRDFSDSHPDFEHGKGHEPGLVRPWLDEAGKPVFDPPAGADTVRDRASFDQWYRDVPGVNASTRVPLTLVSSPDDPRVYSFEDLEFFPIDGELLGNEGRAHNFHFTLEVSTRFAYEGGERFTFAGDDDLWVFVNGFRIIDLGGVHASMTETVRFDDIAEEAGLTAGRVYRLDLFFAERHTGASHFTVHTTAKLGADDPCEEALCPSTQECVAGRCLTPCAAGECLGDGVCIDDYCMALCGLSREEVCVPEDAPVATNPEGDPVLPDLDPSAGGVSPRDSDGEDAGLDAGGRAASVSGCAVRPAAVDALVGLWARRR